MVGFLKQSRTEEVGRWNSEKNERRDLHQGKSSLGGSCFTRISMSFIAFIRYLRSYNVRPFVSSAERLSFANELRHGTKLLMGREWTLRQQCRFEISHWHME